MVFWNIPFALQMHPLPLVTILESQEAGLWEQHQPVPPALCFQLGLASGGSAGGLRAGTQ